jgi:hypothetical protein
MSRIACQVCGSAFEPKRPFARYCSPRCNRAAYARRHLPALEAALAYLQREVRRLENLLPGGTRRRAGRGR